MPVTVLVGFRIFQAPLLIYVIDQCLVFPLYLKTIILDYFCQGMSKTIAYVALIIAFIGVALTDGECSK